MEEVLLSNMTGSHGLASKGSTTPTSYYKGHDNTDDALLQCRFIVCTTKKHAPSQSAWVEQAVPKSLSENILNLLREIGAHKRTHASRLH